MVIPVVFKAMFYVVFSAVTSVVEAKVFAQARLRAS